MTHWLTLALTVLQSEELDLRALAKIAGADSRRFYVGTSLDGVNICGQDLRGMEFTGLNRDAVLFDNCTQLDRRYFRQLIENPNAIRVISEGGENVPEFEALRSAAGNVISEIVRDGYAVDRAARLFKAALDDRRVGALVVANYPRVTSETEGKVIAALSRVERDCAGSDNATYTVAVVRAVDDCLRRVFYHHRPRFLLGLVRYLGENPAMRSFLISKVRRSYSLSEEDEEIAEKLGLSR